MPLCPHGDGDSNNNSSNSDDNEEEEGVQEEEEEEKQKITSVSHDLEELEPSYTAGGTTRWRGRSEPSRSLSRS